jgi:hypothetical protein
VSRAITTTNAIPITIVDFEREACGTVETLSLYVFFVGCITTTVCKFIAVFILNFPGSLISIIIDFQIKQELPSITRSISGSRCGRGRRRRRRGLKCPGIEKSVG